MDFPRSRGGGALGARLRRLSERIDGEAGRVYAGLGISFEQRWFGVLDQLARHDGLTVGELAARLGITHVSVSQTRQSLQRAGLVESQPLPGDARARALALTPAGRALVERLAPAWHALEAVAYELDAEAGQVVAALDRLEAALQRRSLRDRFADRHAAMPEAMSR